MTDMDVFADIVARAIETATAPLLARIAVLEKRALLHGQDGRDGRDAVVDIEALAIKAAALVPRPSDGGIGPAGPSGERGERGEKGIDGAAGQRGPQGEAGPAGEPGPKGADGMDGKDADIPALQAFIESSVETAVRGAVTKAMGALMPPRDGKDGQDGRSVTIEDVAPLVVSEVTKAVSALPKAADGVGIVDALIDRDKALVFTFSDGRTKSVGPVVGADGKAGADGQNGRDGADGKAGADGLGFDDLDAYMDESKGFVIRFQQAERVKEFPFPMMFDAGVYKPGMLYPKGAGVTAQGSFWIAQADTSERPGDGSTSWRLAVKRGRDGKDGKDGGES